LFHNIYSEKQLPPEVANDGSLMQYAIKGTDKQWKNALDGKDINASGTIQIRSVREKRKKVDETDFEREAENDPTSKKDKPRKKKKKGRKST
jgi:hypothetical protein